MALNDGRPTINFNIRVYARLREEFSGVELDAAIGTPKWGGIYWMLRLEDGRCIVGGMDNDALAAVGGQADAVVERIVADARILLASESGVEGRSRPW